jgi:hypothetical protein
MACWSGVGLASMGILRRDPDPDLVRGLADRICRRDRAVHQRRALDALQALLAALANRDQLGLDFGRPLDRQADGVGLSASGHDSGNLSIGAQAGGGRLGTSLVNGRRRLVDQV